MKYLHKNTFIFNILLSLSLSSLSADPEKDKAAEAVKTMAIIELGLKYHTGEGVEVNFKQAMNWYLLAYAKGNGDALNNIGVLYRDGLGVPKNQKIAYLLFLAVHMEGLGTQATQIRAGRNLGRLQQSMKEDELHEALSYTWNYVDQVVRSKGQNFNIGKDVLPSKVKLRIKDNNWWLDSERKKMDFKSPAPWNKSK